MANEWGTQDIGDQRGKKVVVTGANSGIGYYTALELGRAGADVVVACRDPGRGKEALAQLRKEAPDATFRLEALDLADLRSVRAFADRYLATGAPLDLLVNNAGLMMPPTRELTTDGFERQFGTNHLGHFALTGLLIPALARSRAPRVVNVSSSATMFGKIALDNLQSEKRYRPMKAYAQSKLANLAFTLELGRRAPWITSTAAHPGATKSNLQKHAFQRSTQLIGQPTDRGALPTLRAAVADVKSGTYFGPKDWFQMRGAPIEVPLPKHAVNPDQDRALWEASEQLTGVKFELETHGKRAAAST
jgi:NAD(P)-dependent dehydrogenase (short-subunit alcohol dehydrogenase family)